MKLIVLVCVVLAAGVPAGADILFDTGEPGRLGVVVKPDSSTEAIVQPLQTRMSGWAERIGVAVASGADPNRIGFKVTLTDMLAVSGQPTAIPGSGIADSVYLLPIAGPTLAYAYIDIQPVFLDDSQIYGLLIEPGDAQMYGSVALSRYGGLGWGTSDGWATNFRLSMPTCMRIYGTPVPEPSSLLALGATIAGLSLSMRRRSLQRTTRRRD